MSDAVVPSYRVARDGGGMPWRMLAVAGGILGLAALGAAGWWGFGKLGARSVPVVEADPRPFKVRPDDPGGLRVPNQGEMVLERPQLRAQAVQPNRGAALAPPPEAPNLERLRAQATPAAPPSVSPAPVAPPVPVAAAPQPMPAPVPVTAQPAASPPAQAPRPTGRVQVQLGALPSDQGARSEWDRLSRRAPELFQGRSPSVLRLDRGEGQEPLFRLRTGGFADAAAAREFCEQVRTRGGACVVIP